MELEHQLSALIKDHLILTSAVYFHISKTGSFNFISSPFLIEMLLTLIYMGADKASAEQIRVAANHHDCSKDKIKTAITAVVRSLSENNRFVSLKYTNKIYITNNLRLNDEFTALARDVFDVTVETADFSKPGETATTINNWVEKETNNRILNFIDQKKITRQIKALLISALGFCGEWAIPFKSSSTTQKKFYKNGSKVIQVETMECTSVYSHFECDEIKADMIELQFKGTSAAMGIVLPRKKNGLSDVENKIRVPFHLVADDFTREHVTVALPKFKIQNTIDFKAILQKVGIHLIFNCGTAHLDWIASGGDSLCVNEIIQKIDISVKEEGVGDVKSTTADVGLHAASSLTQDRPKQFIVEHPFAFYIRMKDLVLFVGRVLDPTHTDCQNI